MGHWVRPLAGGLKSGLRSAIIWRMGTLDIIVVVALVSVLYLYLRQSNEN
jgi:hypothetical protein